MHSWAPVQSMLVFSTTALNSWYDGIFTLMISSKTSFSTSDVSFCISFKKQERIPFLLFPSPATFDLQDFFFFLCLTWLYLHFFLGLVVSSSDSSVVDSVVCSSDSSVVDTDSSSDELYSLSRLLLSLFLLIFFAFYFFCLLFFLPSACLLKILEGSPRESKSFYMNHAQRIAHWQRKDQQMKGSFSCGQNCSYRFRRFIKSFCPSISDLQSRWEQLHQIMDKVSLVSLLHDFFNPLFTL